MQTSWVMGIFDRMGRVISSNFNPLLDKLDDPSWSVEHLLENMEQELRSARREIVAAVAAQKQLEEKVDGLDAEAKKWADRAELALRRNDEPLAREALAQKQRVTLERDRAEALRTEQRARALEMKTELGRMEQKTREYSLRKNTIAAQVQMSRAGGGAEGLGRMGSSPGPFDELRRMEDQIEGVEAAVLAQRELEETLNGDRVSSMPSAELEARFQELETGHSQPPPPLNVEAELRVLKQKIRVSE